MFKSGGHALEFLRLFFFFKMLTVARYNVWGGNMFCLILAHPWNCILTVMLKTFCLKYLGKSLKEKLVKKKTGFLWDCKFLQGVVVLSYNLSTWETETEELAHVWVQPGLYSETLTQKKKERKQTSSVMFMHTFDRSGGRGRQISIWGKTGLQRNFKRAC